MGILDVLSSFLNLKEENLYEFEKKFLDDVIEIKIIKNGEKIPVSDFDEKQYEYILKTDIIRVNPLSGKIYLPYKNVYMLDSSTMDFFGLPNFFSGTLNIDTSANFLNSNGIKYEIKFVDGENNYFHVTENLIQREKDGKRFFLREDDYEMVMQMYNFNMNEQKNKNPLEQYRIVDKIKKLQKEKDILVSENIDKVGNVAMINKMELDFKEKDENSLSILPKVKDEDKVLTDEIVQEFIVEVAKTKGTQKKYTISKNGNKYELVLSNEILNALQVVKESNGEISKKDFIKQNGPIFQDERMENENIEYNYGPRVKGLGYLNYRANPIITNSDIDWFPEELPFIDTMEGDHISLNPNDIPYLEEKFEEVENDTDEAFLELDNDGEKCCISLTKNQLGMELDKLKNACKEVTHFQKSSDLEKLLELVSNSDEDYIEYKNLYVKNPHDMEVIQKQIEKAKCNEEKKRIENQEKPEKTYLLLKDNIDTLEHIEKITQKESIDEYEEPRSLKEQYHLLPYQKTGVQVMQNLYKSSKINGVLLSDDMGLGKTLQILTFLAWIREKKGNLKALLVMPTSLTTNWYNEDIVERNQGEIQKFFEEDTFKVYVLRGKVNSKSQYNIQRCNILITSYETLRINQLELGKIEWDVMVCDEAQKIKNPKTLLTTAVKGQNADFKIACTATPIENNILDLWCLVDFCMPGLFGSLKKFKQQYFLNSVDDRTLKNINDELKIKLGPHFIRRTKDVLNTQGKEFPKKIIVYEHIPYSHRQKEILANFNKLKVSGESVLPLIQGMIMACSHPQLVSKKHTVDENTKNLMAESFKLRNVKEILDKINVGQEKAIIFTKYKKMQKILSILIKEWYGFTPNIVNGESNPEIRRDLLDEYRNTQGFSVIILSPDAAGFGLNLVEANHVIHYTRHWNPAKEEQATDRAYRIGQEKDVYVYYPMVAHDEKYGKIIFSDLNQWIESNQFNYTSLSSPEEKLNKIIIKKKRLLRDFFLAAPIDTEEKDFDEFNEKSVENERFPLSIENTELLDWKQLEVLSLLLLEKEYNTFGNLTEKSKELGIDGMVHSKAGEIVFHVNTNEDASYEKIWSEIEMGKKLYEKEFGKRIDGFIVLDFNNSVMTEKNENTEFEFWGRDKIERLMNNNSIYPDMINKRLI